MGKSVDLGLKNSEGTVGHYIVILNDSGQEVFRSKIVDGTNGVLTYEDDDTVVGSGVFAMTIE